MLLLFFCNACPGNCTIIPTACQWWQSRSCNQDHYICLSPDRLPGQYPISAGDPCAKDEGKHSWRWNGENWTTQISKLFAESWQRLQNGPTGLSHPHAHLLFALDVFFKFFFLFCHAFRFHLDKYSGGPTGTAWGMARTFQLEGIISWIRNFMGTPYVILAILPHPRCMLDPIFWCLSDSSALFTQQCATAEALRNLAEEWGSQTEKKRENIQGSRGHVFFPSSFLWTTFHIYIYKHVNVLSMHHTSLSLYVFIYIYIVHVTYLSNHHFHITDIQKSYLIFGWMHELGMHSSINCNKPESARPDLFDSVHAHDALLLVDLERAFWSVNACLSIWATLWSGPGSETTRWSHQKLMSWLWGMSDSVATSLELAS